MFTSSRILLCLVVFALILVVLTPVASADPLDVSQVVIGYERYYVNDVPQNIWVLFADVTGTGITGVTVTKPDSSTFSLPVNNPGSDYSLFTHFNSSSDLLSGYPTGAYGFNVNSGALSFSLTLDGTAPGGIAANLSPGHLSTNVPLVPTFSWTSAAGYGIALRSELWTLPGGVPQDPTQGDQQVAFNSYPDMTSTSWDPGVTLDPGSAYSLMVTVFQGSHTTPTVSGDTFDASAIYGFINVSQFTTTAVPEPATLSLLGLGLGGLALWRKRRRAA